MEPSGSRFSRGNKRTRGDAERASGGTGMMGGSERRTSVSDEAHPLTLIGCPAVLGEMADGATRESTVRNWTGGCT